MVAFQSVSKQPLQVSIFTPLAEVQNALHPPETPFHQVEELKLRKESLTQTMNGLAQEKRIAYWSIGKWFEERLDTGLISLQVVE